MERKLFVIVQVIMLLIALNAYSASAQMSGGGGNTGQAQPAAHQDFEDVPSSNPFFSFLRNIAQAGIVGGYPCGGAGEPCGSENLPYYRPNNYVTRAQMAKFVDLARTQPPIVISTTTHPSPFVVSTGAFDGIGVIGRHSATTGAAPGVQGETSSTSSGAIGVQGIVNSTSAGSFSAGVRGFNNGTGSAGYGVWGYHAGGGIGVTGASQSGFGVYGAALGSSGINFGVYGVNYSPSGWAGYFDGNVGVSGNLSKGGGSFKIDHPQDPANKYLYHSFVESPDMMNVYNGNVTTDASGEAVVTLPDYFETLNRDFRYQLTVVGQFAQAIVGSEIKNNAFTIKTDKPNVKVSWQVTGIRKDPYAEKYRIPVEEAKPQEEKGYYLHPELYGQPKNKQLGWQEPPMPAEK